jgi:O-antigen ligase
LSSSEPKPTRAVAKIAGLLDGLIFVGLLALIVIVAIPYGTVDAWWESVFECIVWALTAIWLLKISFPGNTNIRKVLILLPLVLIALYAFSQVVVWPTWLARGFTGLSAQRTLTIDRYQTYLTARKILALTLFLGLLFLHVSTPFRLRWLVRVVIGVGVASALFGILRQLLQSPDSADGFVLPFLFPGIGYGQFISPNVFAYLMEMTLALLAGLVFGGGVRRERVLIYLAISVPVWAALVLSNSRGGIIGLICSVIFVLFISLNWHATRAVARPGGAGNRWWLLLTARWTRVVLMIVIVGTLLTTVFWMGGETLFSKLQGESAPQEAVDGTRQEIWRSSWKLARQNPWTGVGFGAYFLAIPQYQRSAGTVKLEEAHDDYLDLAANGGVVAVVLACWFAFNIIRRTRFALKSRDAYRRAVCLGAEAGLIAICVHSFVDFGLQITGIAVVFGALIVISAADKNVEARSDSGNTQ